LNTIFAFIDHNRMHPSLLRSVVEPEAHQGEYKERRSHYTLRGDEMYVLNHAAYRWRYGANDINQVDNYSYREPTNPPSIIETIKALNCWLYQCTEGVCPDSACFQHWEKFRNRLQSLVISQMQEYQNAPWGEGSEDYAPVWSDWKGSTPA
jgi:hypothetical protein